MASSLGLFSHISEFKFGMWRDGGGNFIDESRFELFLREF